jgi:small subunit ribosomal protein S20
MANTKQARKRARQTVARNLHLAAQRSQYRTAIKKVRKLVAAGVKAAESTIDKMARKGVLHGNAAARHKSRLAAEIKALA